MPESTISRLAKDPVSRRKFMALTGGSTALGQPHDRLRGWARRRRRNSQFGKGDVGILNYALTLEYLETAFYEEAKSGPSRAVN